MMAFRTEGTERMAADSAERPAIIGVDYGTASVRAVVVDTATGAELGEGEYAYAHGTDGVIGDSRDTLLARQSPRDYVDGLRVSIRRALEAASENALRPIRRCGDRCGHNGIEPNSR